MTKRTKADIEVALRVLAHERGTSGSAVERATAAVLVYQQLADRLGPLVGTSGFQALFARSLKLTRTDFPCFGEVASGEELLAGLKTLEPAATTDAAAALFATLFRLLTAFIGERLVWQVLRGAFEFIDESTSKETES